MIEEGHRLVDPTLPDERAALEQARVGDDLSSPLGVAYGSCRSGGGTHPHEIGQRVRSPRHDQVEARIPQVGKRARKFSIVVSASRGTPDRTCALASLKTCSTSSGKNVDSDCQSSIASAHALVISR